MTALACIEGSPFARPTDDGRQDNQRVGPRSLREYKKTVEAGGSSRDV